MSSTGEPGGRNAANLLPGEVPERTIMRAAGSTDEDGPIFRINGRQGER
jgi:hypothetical protein